MPRTDTTQWHVERFNIGNMTDAKYSCFNFGLLLIGVSVVAIILKLNDSYEPPY